MQLVIPSLFQTPSLLDLMGEPRLPVLDRLLARGVRSDMDAGGVESWLCRELGLAYPGDWPAAAISLAASGGDPGNHIWLRADPVHVRIERDRLVLAAIPELDSGEAAQLCAALGAHFGEEFAPRVLASGAWIVRAETHGDIATTALSEAMGQAVAPLLPRGADAMHWRKLLNEAQMLLFAHPVNQAREARGQPVVNSLWLWGVGNLPSRPQPGHRPMLMGDSALLRELAWFAGTSRLPLAEAWNRDIADNTVVVMDAPQAQLQRGDWAAWLETVRGIETRWLHPLYAGGRAFSIIDPASASRLDWKSPYRWKFWRRPPRPDGGNAGIPLPAAPASRDNVDEFGNRF